MDKFFAFYFVLPISVGVAISLAGWILLAIDARRKMKIEGAESQTWEATGGKVVEVHMEKCDEGQGNSTPVLKPVVEYVYSVNETEYSGKIIFPQTCDKAGPEAANEFIERFPLNAYVPIRYNPDEPSVSRLEEKKRHSNRVRFIGLLCTYFGISVCCFTSFMAFVILGNIL